MPFFGTTSTAIDIRAPRTMTTGEIVAVNFRCGVERETTRAAPPVAERAPGTCRADNPATHSASSIATTPRVPCIFLLAEGLLDIALESLFIAGRVPGVLREDLPA